MNRIDRLFGILLLLQRKSRLQAKEIAEHYEITVRTVYRDISALYDLGVPIISIPGEGYSLMDGFYLPPLIFTPDEASALFLGGQLLVHQADGKLPNNTISALNKISAILPPHTTHHINQLSQIIHFSLSPKTLNLDDPKLIQIQSAILDQKILHLIYHSLKDDAVTKRYVEPYQLTYGNHNWYLTAYCQLRKDVREFRLDRIDHLTTTKQTFTPRHLHQVDQAIRVVKIQMKVDHARWVKERQHYGFIHEETAGDKSIMTYHIHQFNEIKAWILAWGASVQVIEPQELVDTIREEIKQLLELLT